MISAWVPGQGVRIDYAAIVEILIQQLDGDRMFIISCILQRLHRTQTMKYSNPRPCVGSANS